MRSARRSGWAAIFSLLSVICVSAANYSFDTEEPDVKDRVARISFLKGDVQIKRSDNDQWEKAVLNLPIVEGDEISAGTDARAEVQFGAYSHLRLAERSTLRILSLKYGVAVVGLPEGSLALTLSRFDPASDAFEIDVPKTTVAVQKAGRYRVDAGPTGYEAVRISIPGEGEARIYSNNSGFTLNAGRSARVFVSGKFTGEWETGDAAQYADNFDQWSVDRDDTIAKRQAQAYYGKYYDTDIYGADDLSDHGEWINTFDYGWVWRPNSSAISVYSDWSPYRYGAWRWVPRFGWAWVNAEPWGWATYHHGRWIWYNGGWYWAPYGFYRQSRSWWYPALVVLQQFNRSICWYPLPYRRPYRNYNRHRDRDGNRKIPGPRPVVAQANVPANADTGVISVPADVFGKTNGGYTKLPQAAGRQIILREAAEEELPELPVMQEINSKVSDEIRVVKQKAATPIIYATVGASPRNGGEPLDNELRNKIIFGDRTPVVTTTDPVENAEGKTVTRKTGAVERMPQPSADSPPIIVQTPNIEPAPRKSDAEKDPARSERSVEPPRRDVPIYVPRERIESPAQKSEPRNEPQKRSDPAPTRSETKSEPKSEPTKRSDPPPQRSEPQKSEPSKQPDSREKKP